MGDGLFYLGRPLGYLFIFFIVILVLTVCIGVPALLVYLILDVDGGGNDCYDDVIPNQPSPSGQSVTNSIVDADFEGW